MVPILGEIMTMIRWGEVAKAKLYKSIVVRLPEELAARLDAYRATSGETQSQLIRDAIEEYLNKREGGRNTKNSDAGLG